MFRIALIGTISAVLLLAAGTIASARGIDPSIGGIGGYGHALNGTSHVERMSIGDTTTTDGPTTMPGSSETMASNFAHAADQMRVRAAQMEAATQMQPTTGMDPGYGMQSDNTGTGTGYMDPGNMGSTTTTRTTGSSTHMGTTGTGTTQTSSSSTMGSGGGSMMGR